MELITLEIETAWGRSETEEEPALTVNNVIYDYKRKPDALKWKPDLPKPDNQSQSVRWFLLDPAPMGEYEWDESLTVQANLEAALGKPIAAQEDVPLSITLEADYSDMLRVVYDPNGGSFTKDVGPSGMLIQYYKADATCSLPDEKPIKSMADFKGWATDPETDGEPWEDGMKVKASLRVYAQYEDFDLTNHDSVNSRFGTAPTLIGDIQCGNADVEAWTLTVGGRQPDSDIVDAILRNGIEAFRNSTEGRAYLDANGDLRTSDDHLLNCKGCVLSYGGSSKVISLVGLVDSNITYDTFTIPSTINGMPVYVEKGMLRSLQAKNVIFGAAVEGNTVITETDNSLFNGNPYVEYVYMDTTSLVALGDSTFKDCINLKGVALPDTLQAIGDCAFERCGSLSKADIGPMVSRIGEDAFLRCSNLTAVSIRTPYMNSMKKAFRDEAAGDAPAHIDLTLEDTVVILPSEAFYGCRALKSVKVAANGRLSKICGSAFDGCRRLETVVLQQSGSNSHLESIDSRAFADTSISAIEIPETVSHYYDTSDSFVNEQVNDIFSGTPLKKTTIGGALTAVTPYMLRWNTQLEEIVLREGIESVGGRCFSGFPYLKKVTLPTTLMWIDYEAFSGCTALETVIAGPSLCSIGNRGFEQSYPVFYALPDTARNEWLSEWCAANGCTYVYGALPRVNVRFDDGLGGVPSPAGSEVAAASTLAESAAHFGDGLDNGPSPADSVEVDALGTLTEPDAPTREGWVFLGWFAPNSNVPWDFANDRVPLNDLVLTARWAMENANGRYRIDGDHAVLVSYVVSDGSTLAYIPSTWRGVPVTAIEDGAFAGEPVTAIELPADIAGLTAATFAGAEMLYSVRLRAGDSDYAVQDGMLYTADGTRLVFCPPKRRVSVYDMPENLTAISGGAFRGNGALEEIAFNDALIEIGDYAFAECAGLTELNLPESLLRIGEGAFMNCGNLAQVSGAPNCIRIGDDAFAGTGVCVFYGDGDSALTRYAEANGRGYNIYSVDYLLDGESVGVRHVKAGSALPRPQPEAPEGRVAFDGWFADSELSQSWDFDAMRMPAADLTLYTKSVPLFETEPFAADGDGLRVTAYNGAEVKIVIPERIDGIAVRAVDAAGIPEERAVELPGDLMEIDADAFAARHIALYAPRDSATEQLLANAGYPSSVPIRILTFDACGGALVEAVEVPVGGEVILPGAVRDGGTLEGWYYNDYLSDRAGGEGDVFVMPDDDTTLYAEWSAEAPEYGFLWEQRGDAVAVTGSVGAKEVVVPATINGLPVTAVDGSAFCDDRALAFLSLPEGLVEIGEFAFRGTALTEVALPSTVRSVGRYAFAGCDKLEVFAWSPSAAVLSEGLLYGDRALWKIGLPEGIAQIDAYALADCRSLAALTLPDSVGTVSEGAFLDMTSLRTLSLGANLTRLSSTALNGCGGLRSIAVSHENARYESVDGVLYYTDRAGIVKYPAGRSGDSYAIDGNAMLVDPRAFCGARALKHLALPDGIVQIEAEAFADSGLTEIDLSGLTALCGLPDGAFAGCEALAQAVLPAELAEIGSDAFNRDVALQTLEVPDAVQDIGGDAFYDGTLLIVGQGSTAHLYALRNGLPYRLRDAGDDVVPAESITSEKQSLTLLAGLPYTLHIEVLPADTTDELLCFSGDVGLLRIDDDGYIRPLKPGDTEVTLCAGEAELTVPVRIVDTPIEIVQRPACLYTDETLQLTVRNITDNCPDFEITWSCSGASVAPDGRLSSDEMGIVRVRAKAPYGKAAAQSFVFLARDQALTLPAGTKVVGEEAFMDNRSITGVAIPGGTQAVGDRAFAGCDSLRIAWIADADTSISDTAFDDCPNLTIVCPEGSSAEKFARDNELDVFPIS